jgi:antirestriction protein ArdC
MTPERFDIHQHVTNQIVATLEQGAGNFCLPWHRADASTMRPVNAASKAAYRGVNILALWAAAEQKGFASGLWGTYRQWESLGAQVRKGERASYVVFYKDRSWNTSADPSNNDGDSAPSRTLLARASAVFAAEQVDNFTLPTPTATDAVVADQRAESFIAANGATIVHDGSRAFYRHSTDRFICPTGDVYRHGDKLADRGLLRHAFPRVDALDRASGPMRPSLRLSQILAVFATYPAISTAQEAAAARP